MCGTCVFRISFLPYLCVMQYFHVIHVETYSYVWKPERSCTTICTTYGIRRKRERLRQRNKHDRDHRAAESAQQRESWLVRQERSAERLACGSPSNNPHWAGSRAQKEEVSLGTKLRKELLKLHTTTPVLHWKIVSQARLSLRRGESGQIPFRLLCCILSSSASNELGVNIIGTCSAKEGLPLLRLAL